MESFKEIERKWQKKWLESKIFYSDRNDKPKYFLTTPYPYVSGLLHLGHAVTSLHPDVIARYKRMRGYNVLWSFGFHATGSPISTAAQKVKDRDEKQINALKLMLGDLSEEELKKFEDDTYWVKFFSEEDKKDLYAYGLSLDPRRHFITTELNPPYARFVEWQMRKLKEKGYIVRGNYPVVWCPHCKVAIGDHARAEGEGETVQEFTLLKFKFTYHSKPVFLVAATLRPETVYGQTNFWINPSLHYVLIRVKYSQNNKDYDEHWILSRRAADRLKDQGKDVTILEDVDPEELIGKTCLAPKVHRDIPILPAEFVEENFGTGLVTSVPSDAPHDYIALIELQKDANLRRKLHVPEEVVKDIKPIPIIDSEEYGDMPAVKICKELNITSQNDPDLELAKKKVYSIGFHTGVLKDTCGKYAGMPVEKAKELMKEEMIEEGEATTFYELTGKVVCRCGTEAIPKLVNDQWFMDYSNPEWKKKVHEAIDSMTFVPEIVRKQFHHTVDWLKKWPCTREHGLGEHLPWDKKWLVESLSDSTIYMAYYILAKYLQHPRDYGLTQEIVNNLNDDFFDYVLLGKGSAKKVESSCHVPEDLVEEIRKDFLYYYPHDYRNSGKDLIQNHLTFSIFHHVAIFYDEHWILSRRAADRLKDQGKDVTILEDVDPEELIGKTCLAPKVHRDIPILPAEFVEENFGTGLVTSVPSDAPHDYIALIELQKDANLRRKLHVPEEVVKDIKPIPIIDSEEYGDMPAVKICKELNITSQNDPDLELAKKKVYSIGFHTGVLKDTCGKYAGMPVEKAKELMKEEMIEEGEATTFYELTGKVVCRCGTEAIPKLVNDQWFMDYSNPEWKKKVHEAIDSMTFVPEIVRKQFHHTVDWLKKWPCTREHGLGEHLPWDKKWLVESLSDSTIYMAYYILAKYLQHPRDYGLTQEIVNNLNDDFFDYVLLGKGSAKKVESSCHVPEDLVEEIRKDFLYYYPHDYRNSGKDLIQNHLTFSIFHHVAIFPKEFWPKLYDINGFVKLQGQKMSKSKGNFKTLRQLLEKFGADITRVASLYAGEGLDDPKFEYNFFDSAKQKLTNIFLLLNEKGTSEEYDWPEELFESRINELIKDVTEALDSFKYRTYIQKLIFEYYSIFQEYKKIVSKMGRGMNKALVHKYLSAYYRMLQPATPHLAEEAWHLLGNDTFVSLEKWPEYDESKIKEDAKFIVNIATTIVDDVRTIQRLVKINKIKRITLVTAPLKKYEMLKDIKELVDEGKEYSEIVKTIMSKYRDNSVKLDKLMKNIPSSILDESKERDALTKIIPLLKKEFNCEVIVMHSEDSKGMPGKPAIFIE